MGLKFSRERYSLRVEKQIDLFLSDPFLTKWIAIHYEKRLEADPKLELWIDSDLFLFGERNTYLVYLCPISARQDLLNRSGLLETVGGAALLRSLSST